MGKGTIEKLREHQAKQQLERQFAGDSWQEHDLIFPSVVGTPWDPRNVLKEFKKILGQAGLSKMRFHDLRHTSITLILNDIGAPVKEAQRRAGHASPSTTINIYGGEASMKLDEIVAQSLDELVTPIQVNISPKEPKSQTVKRVT